MFNKRRHIQCHLCSWNRKTTPELHQDHMRRCHPGFEPFMENINNDVNDIGIDVIEVDGVDYLIVNGTLLKVQSLEE